jgi:hypothetical protein
MPESPEKVARPSAKADNKEQSRAFIEKAREIGPDEDKSAADELLGQLAKKAAYVRQKETRPMKEAKKRTDNSGDEKPSVWLNTALPIIALILTIPMIYIKLANTASGDFDPRTFALFSIAPAAMGAFLVVAALRDGRDEQLEFKIFGLTFKGRGGAVILWIASFVALMGMVLAAAKLLA